MNPAFINRRAFFISVATAIFGKGLAAKWWPTPELSGVDGGSYFSIEEFKNKFLAAHIRHIADHLNYACGTGYGYHRVIDPQKLKADGYYRRAWRTKLSELAANPRGSYAAYDHLAKELEKGSA